MDMSEKVIKSLHLVLESIEEGLENTALGENAFSSSAGWNSLSLDKDSLIIYIQGFSDYLDTIDTEVMPEELKDYLEKCVILLESFLSKTLPQVRNNIKNIVHVAPALISTLGTMKECISLLREDNPVERSISNLRIDLESLVSDYKSLDSVLTDTSHLHKKLEEAKQSIEFLYNGAEELDSKVEVINKANEQAQDLPSLIKELDLGSQSIKDKIKVLTSLDTELESKKSSLYDDFKLVHSYEREAAELIKECKRSRNTAVSEGLASGFETKAKELQISINWWISGLVAALLLGMTFGYVRSEQLTEILKMDLTFGQAFLHFIITVFSVGGPFWLAWLCTRQINKCFTLSEDYAYKATVTRAYTGFQDEAEKFADDTAQQIFHSAISRLDEMPLRLIHDKDHSSPLHELMNSEAIRKAGPEVMIELTKAFTKGKQSFSSKVKNSLNTKTPPPTTAQQSDTIN